MSSWQQEGSKAGLDSIWCGCMLHWDLLPMPLTHPLQFLHGTVSRNSDIYLDELQEDLWQICGVLVSKSSIWRALRRSGYTMKKVMLTFCCCVINDTHFPLKLTRVAAERSAEKHANYIMRIGRYSRDQLVFVDESACDQCMTYRGRTWAISGQCAIWKAFFVRGKWWVYVLYVTWLSNDSLC